MSEPLSVTIDGDDYILTDPEEIAGFWLQFLEHWDVEGETCH
jgi:hypothetical protein